MEGDSDAGGVKESLTTGEAHHAIQIWDVDNTLVHSMEQKIQEMPRLLCQSAGRKSCCIFRVPRSLVKLNEIAYQPLLVSIGPFHHGKEHLRMIEEHKWRFLGGLLSRTEKIGLRLEDYVKAIRPMEKRARECYSETISFDADTFVEMMVLDGCFIIELFRKVGFLAPVHQDDPIFTMKWVRPFLMRDLLRLENQLPFFVLQDLFNLSDVPGQGNATRGASLATLALEFFNDAMERPDEVIARFHNLKAVHLLDLFRSSFIPEVEKANPRKVNPPQFIQYMTKLQLAGIKLKQRTADSFLDIKFKNGVLEIPPITIDDFTSSVFQNLVAFEQCYGSCSMHITTYVAFLDCLINTAADVGLLRDSDVIENYFGTDEEVAQFINNLGQDVAFDINDCHLSKLFGDVNEYYKNNWHVQWASFKHTYFNTPWSFISALAAFTLLLLTIAQTFFAIYGYAHPPS